MAMVPNDSSHHGVVDNSPNGFTQGRCEEDRKLGPLWYFSRKEIEENSPSRRDGIDLKRENSLRKSYCTFLQDLGMKLKVPQVSIATAMVFCHRFYLRQSHAKNDRRIIATVCMFLAGKVEETPRPLKDVIVVSYEIIHKKDPNAGQRIKQQKEIYDKQKELILLGERVVLVTLGFDLNIHHAYKPLVEAIRRFNVGTTSLPQVAWNFVNDGLRTSLCLQFEPHHIAAGAIFLAAKFLKIKLPSDGDKIWWQDFDVTPRQLEEVSNQMLELYEQNRTTQAQASQGSEAEGSSAGVRNPHSSVKSEANSKDPSASGHHQSSKLPNSSSAGATGHHGVGLSNSDKHISGPKMHKNDNGNHGGSKDKSSKSGIKSDAGMDRSHRDKKSSPGRSHHSKSNHEILKPKEEHQPHRSHDNPNETRDGVLGGNEAPGVSSSMMDAMNKIDKDKVKAALEKRRKSKGGVATNVNVIDDDDLLERELEHGVELAVEDEKIKQDKRQNLSHGSMPPAVLQHDHAMENGNNVEQSVATTADDEEIPRNSKEQHCQPFDKQNDSYEHKSQQDDPSLKHDKGHDDELAGRHEQDGRDNYEMPKLEDAQDNKV